jgi:uncharacterized protein YxjI
MIAALLALGAGPGSGWGDDALDSDARESPWRQPSPLRAGPFDGDFATAGDEADPGETSPERLRLYDELGNPTGRVERLPPGLSDSWNVYDETGMRTGRLERNPLDESRLNLYDTQGRRVRTIRKHAVLEDRYEIYDDSGRRVGSVRGSPFGEGRYDIYDEQGRRTGRAESR